MWQLRYEEDARLSAKLQQVNLEVAEIERLAKLKDFIMECLRDIRLECIKTKCSMP